MTEESLNLNMEHKNFEFEKMREKLYFKKDQSLSGSRTKCSICVIGVPESQQKDWVRKKNEETIAGNFPNLKKEIGFYMNMKFTQF